MNAVDTNVLVRLLAGDDHAQEQAAKSLFAAESVWIAKTVLLETGWVLASVFGYDESTIRHAILSVLLADGSRLPVEIPALAGRYVRRRRRGFGLRSGGFLCVGARHPNQTRQGESDAGAEQSTLSQRVARNWRDEAPPECVSA